MDRHGRGSGGQRRFHHPSGQRAGPVEQDADLHGGHAVAVQHDVAAPPIDPAGAEAIPDLAEKPSPERGEFLPRRPDGDDGGPA